MLSEVGFLVLLGAFFLVLILEIGLTLFARSVKKAGRLEAERDILLAGERRRDAFDEEVSRPLSTGSDLIARLRKRVGR